MSREEYGIINGCSPGAFDQKVDFLLSKPAMNYASAFELATKWQCACVIGEYLCIALSGGDARNTLREEI